jgi:hypothetical protein
MFLPDVERNPRPSPTTDLIRAAQSATTESPKIWHPYRPEATPHLGAFTHEIKARAGPISPGCGN